MKIELADDGYEIIEARIQELENLAWDGVFSKIGIVDRFQKIVWKTKELRQIVRGALILVPDASKAPGGEGGAA